MDMRFRVHEVWQRLTVAVGFAAVNACSCLAGWCLRVIDAIGRRGREK